MEKYLFRTRSETTTIVMEEERDKLEKMYQKLNEEKNSDLKKWN